MRQVIKTKRRARGEEKEKRKKVREACRKIDALAKKLGKWDPQTTIRKFRDSKLNDGDCYAAKLGQLIVVAPLATSELSVKRR